MKDKNNSTHRMLVLKQKEGEKIRSTTGLVDPRLFQGGNNVHVQMQPDGLWRIRYDAGVVPIPLQDKFTSCEKLLKHTRKYFATRGVDVVDVINIHEDDY